MQELINDIIECFGFVGATLPTGERQGKTTGSRMYIALQMDLLECDRFNNESYFYLEGSFFKSDKVSEYGRAFYKDGHTHLLINGVVYIINNGVIIAEKEI